jgi:methyltransferase family protein
MTAATPPDPPGSRWLDGIDYFNRAHTLHGVKAVVALRARRRMYARVLALTQPSRETRILDVGTTPDLTIPYNNFFERWYRFPERLTACSIEDCSVLEARFPGLTFRRSDGGALPFSDREFDLALSFAVLEHVGGREQQERFLAELARVSSAFIAYTPYRYFPVEMHTLLPFTHWLPVGAYRALWRRLGLHFWAEESNLNLLSIRTVRPLLPRFGNVTVRLLRTFGWPSNIEIFWTRESRRG